MWGDRKLDDGATNLFAYDDEGKKYRLSPSDFGAQLEERLGSQVQGLGRPPPTQFISVPRDLMSTDDVLRDMLRERRTFNWQLRLTVSVARRFYGRALRVIGRWRRAGLIELERLMDRVHRSVRDLDNEDASWSEDLTVIAQSPPPLRAKSRRPSFV